ncbi:MAG: hypothetical protein ABR526_07075 [Chthoniobacterales bacterium]
MKTLTSRSAKLGTICSLLLGAAPGAFAADVVLQKVPSFTVEKASTPTDEEVGSFALISYTAAAVPTTARALYVSSGDNLQQAGNMIDDKVATTYDFASEDGSPTTIIDLGKTSSVRRLSAAYAPRAGSMQFYVMDSLPAGAENMPQSVNLSEETVATLKPVATATDDGTMGRAAAEFPGTTGRYVMVRWTPAAQANTSFSLAEVAAFDDQNKRLLAANNGGREGMSADELQTSDGKTMLDGKTVMDGKTMLESKDMPGEGPAESAPQSPGEGPPPTLPQPPPFTFVPVLVPNSP